MCLVSSNLRLILSKPLFDLDMDYFSIHENDDVVSKELYWLVHIFEQFDDAADKTQLEVFQILCINAFIMTCVLRTNSVTFKCPILLFCHTTRNR